MRKTTITAFTKIGRVLKTHGLEGALVVDIHSDFRDPFLSAEFVFLDLKGSIVPFFVESIQQEDPWIILLEAVHDPESAAEIAPTDMLLPSSEVPQVKAEGIDQDFAWAAGFTVFSTDQKRIGTIERVESYPQQSMAIVSHQDREVMLPLHVELIIEVDHSARSVIIDIPDGLLDLQD